MEAERGRALALLATLTLALACTRTPSPDRQRRTPSEPAQARSSPTLHASLERRGQHPGEHPGSAYFIVSGRGVVHLDHGEWTLIEPSPSSSRRDGRTLSQLFLGADGHAYGLGSQRLVRLEGDRIEELASTDKHGNFASAAIGGAGEFALFESRRRPGQATETILHFMRDGLLLTSSNEFQNAQSALDARGRLWTWDQRRAVTIERLLWPAPVDRRVDVELPKPPGEPATFATSPSGEIYMFVDEAAFHLSGHDTPKIPLPGVPMPGRASVSATGNFALAWPGTCKIVRVEVGNPPRVEAIDAAINCHFEDYVQAIDGQDRIWVPTSTALWVFAPGEAPTKYGFGTVALLAAGAHAIAIVGAGPDLPPPGPIGRADLRGRLVFEVPDESPANRSLVLRSGSGSVEPPPEFVFHTTSDEAGEFTFSQVPIGPYTLSLEDGRHTWYLRDAANQMRDAETLDLGLLQWHPPLLEQLR